MHQSRWKFSIAVLAPVVAAVLLTIALAGGFFFWSAQRTDDAALARQQSLAAHLVRLTQSDFEASQRSVVLQYDIVDALLGNEPDLEVIDAEMGWSEYDTFGHDRVYVLDADLRPIYAARAGESQDVALYDEDRGFIDPMAVRFRSPELAAAIAAYEAGETDWPPQLSDIVDIDGRIAFVSTLPIVSNWEEQEQDPGTYYTHVAIQFLDNGIASGMAKDYLLTGAHFDASPGLARNQTMVPVANQAGRFVAWFKWQPDRPGRALLTEMLPVGLGLLAVIGIVIALLLIGLGRSTAALDRARAEAQHRATHDALTGLANRALFNERLERSPLPLSLLALDLDRFKQVNDTLGHEAGDELLKQVTGRLTTIVGDKGMVARLGGDEFMVLVASTHDRSVLTELAGDIVTALAEPFHLGRHVANIGVSVGIAIALTDERNELVARADSALYDAKESGRNTYRLFEDIKAAA